MVPSCLNCEFRETGCLKRQPDEAVAKFSDLLVRYTVKGKGKTILNQGDAPRGVYFLCRGMLKFTRVRADGEETIQDLLAPCSVVGGVHVAKADHVRISSTVTVLEQTDMAVLHNEDVLLVFQNLPELGIGLAEHLSARLRQVYMLVGYLKLPVAKRVLAILARVLVLLTGKCENGLFAIPLSYRELAQFAQTTPETLSRTLRSFQDKGIVRVEKKGLRVMRAEALKEFLDSHD